MRSQSSSPAALEDRAPSIMSLRPLLAAVFLAVVCWGWIFALDWGNFWWKMTASTGVLAGLSLWFNRAELRSEYRISWLVAGLGILSALILYGVFWVGGHFLRAILPASGELIGAVYMTKSALPAWAITLLLIFIIGPAEEIFWRGLVQKHLAAATGPRFGLLAGAVIYALVHLWAQNGVLVLAAFVCGLAWGWQYKRCGTLTGVIISHVLWDVAVFILVPLR